MMRRTLLATAPLPIAVQAQMAASGAPAVPTGPGAFIRMGGVEIQFLIDKHQSRGSLDMFELKVGPGAQVPAPHYHESWEETVYGLEGEMTWTVAGAEVVTRPGDHAFIARGVAHGFVNRGATTARVLSVLTPGVLGPEYFQELAALLARGTPDPAAVGAIMRRHGLIPVQG